MNKLEHWIATGKIAQWVAGKLDAATHAEIWEAAKAHAEVRIAILSAKEALMAELLAYAASQDPQGLIDAGMLEAYAVGDLPLEQRQYVELMAMVHPQVSAAMDVIKRSMVSSEIARIAALDPLAYLETGILEDYVLGDCAPSKMLEVELAASLHPSIGQVLASLQSVDAGLVKIGAVRPPKRSKDRFMSFLSEAEMPADGWGLVIPMLHGASTAADFDPWLQRVDPRAIPADASFTVIPLDAQPEALTLLIVATELVAEETHLDAIERFLILEGSCYVEMAGQQHHLKAGDYFRIPKFTSHKIVVTSSVPCRLIAQQIAA